MRGTNIERELNEFFSKYAGDLGSYNAEALASNYGFPTMTLSSEFAGSVATKKELEQTLSQAFAYYKSFGFASAKYSIRQVNLISPQILSVRVTWGYYNRNDEKLVESDYEYVLKKDDGKYKVYVAIAIKDQAKAADL
ncbi:MAG: hypothetical protein ABIQ44_05630 [Chloroflexia bacterium]